MNFKNYLVILSLFLVFFTGCDSKKATIDKSFYPVDANNSSVVANPTSVIADGKTSSTITIKPLIK
jgi:hypothetical protein